MKKKGNVPPPPFEEEAEATPTVTSVDTFSTHSVCFHLSTGEQIDVIPVGCPSNAKSAEARDRLYAALVATGIRRRR